MMTEYKPPAEDEVIEIRSRKVQRIRKTQDAVLLRSGMHAVILCLNRESGCAPSA